MGCSSHCNTLVTHLDIGEHPTEPAITYYPAVTSNWSPSCTRSPSTVITTQSTHPCITTLPPTGAILSPPYPINPCCTPSEAYGTLAHAFHVPVTGFPPFSSGHTGSHVIPEVIPMSPLSSHPSSPRPNSSHNVDRFSGDGFVPGHMYPSTVASPPACL